MQAGVLDRPAPRFDAPDLLARLEAMSPAEIDALPFGVIGLGAEMEVELYNAHEAELAGLSSSRVLGRHFFEEVAPCMNNFMVASRFEEEELDEQVPFILTLRMRPTPVTLRLMRRCGAARAWLVLDRTGPMA